MNRLNELNKQQKVMLAGAGALLAGGLMYFAMRRPSHVSHSWKDSEHNNERYLTKNEAQDRASVVSDVSYKLAFALVANKDSFHGHQTAKFTLAANPTGDLFFDFKGRSISNLEINGVLLSTQRHADLFKSHKIRLPKDCLIKGENIVKVAFHGEFVTDCQGMQKYKDQVDETEYIYTMSEPFSAHRWFPCFDQPDIKAPYELLVTASEGWTVVATAAGEVLLNGAEQAAKDFGVTPDMQSSFDGKPYRTFQFKKSAKISTYLYCICAGPLACFEPVGANIDD